jgi:heme/copper-type cytochrome/quinol oxidase subunit 2
VYQNGRNDHRHGAESIGENVKEDTMHIFVTVGVIVAVVMSMVVVAVLEAKDADQVHK